MPVEERPWQNESKMQNAMRIAEHRRELEHNPNWRPPELLQIDPIPPDEWLFFPGDKVVLKVGKDKGQLGVVSYVVPERNWVFVRGMNVVSAAR